MSPSDLARLVLAANGRGEEVVSVLASAGAQAGARVLVWRDGDMKGSLGSAALDRAAGEAARAVFAAREPLLVEGLFAELHAPAERLFIFGAGHIAVPLAKLGSELGFLVTVLDDRSEFASEARFADGVTVCSLDLSDPLHDLVMDARSYVVLVTRAHEHDFALLRALLLQDEQPKYIGMIGSRRRVRAAFTALLAGDVQRERLEHVRAPVGLDIGAETPAEIAVSIAAELIAVRHGITTDTLSSEERVLERFFSGR